ncbi:MAG: adenine deaminase C-terminal domain-containing protein [Nitrososphaeria archaeon]
MLLTNHYNILERKKIIDVCMNLRRPSLALVGGYVLDLVFQKIRKSDIIIEDKRIAYVGDVKDVLEPYEIFEVDGKVIIPGLIDAHAHVESVMVTPSVYSSLVIPEGTTCAVVDPHEIANVSGIKGLKAFLKESQLVPFKFYLQAPSCVPSSAELETSGAELDELDVKRMLKSGFRGLGELMDFRNVIEGKEQFLSKIKFAYENTGIIDGHAPKVSGKILQAYVAGGIMTDHTARTATEVIEKLEAGLYILIQDRPIESFFEEIINTIKQLNLDRVCFCTDDIEPDEIVESGHLLKIVKKAVNFGLDPLKAIKMVTLNPATLYGIQWDVGLIAPGRYADLLVLDDPRELDIKKVIVNGKIVASNRKLLVDKVEKISFNMFKKTIKVKMGLKPEDLVVKADVESGKASVRVLNLDGEIEEHVLEVIDYEILPDVSKDIVRVAVLERHGKNGNIGKGFIRGLGIKRGAMATSVSHDAHNVTVAGIAKEDMYVAVKEIEGGGGGLVVVEGGKCLAKVTLPYFGLLTDNLKISEELKELRNAASHIGLNVPLRRFMFLALPVGRGRFKITDKGIVSYQDKKIFPPIIKLLA